MKSKIQATANVQTHFKRLRFQKCIRWESVCLNWESVFKVLNRAPMHVYNVNPWGSVCISGVNRACICVYIKTQ